MGWLKYRVSQFFRPISIVNNFFFEVDPHKYGIKMISKIGRFIIEKILMKNLKFCCLFARNEKDRAFFSDRAEKFKKIIIILLRNRAMYCNDMTYYVKCISISAMSFHVL